MCVCLDVFQVAFFRTFVLVNVAAGHLGSPKRFSPIHTPDGPMDSKPTENKGREEAKRPRALPPQVNLYGRFRNTDGADPIVGEFYAA